MTIAESDERPMSAHFTAGVGDLDGGPPAPAVAGARSSTLRRLSSVVVRAPKSTVVVADLLAILLGVAVSYGLLEWTFDRPVMTKDSTLGLAFVTAAALGLHVLFLAQHRLYVSRFLSRGVDEARRVVRACVRATIGIAAGGFAL